MKIFTLLIFLVGFYGTVLAQEEKRPAWLDTIPPKLKITPSQQYHNKPFYISFKADENAIIRVGINNSEKLGVFQKALSLSTAGKTVLYYQGEDAYGNKSVLDSMIYIIDYQSPNLKIVPNPGIYRTPISLKVSSNEPCKFFYHRDPDGTNKTHMKAAMTISDKFTGYITAIDRAGNSTRSKELSYIIDSSSVEVSLIPPPGIYNYPVEISFKTSKRAQILYSFNPLALPKWFIPYEKPILCPSPLTLIRYFSRNQFGHESEIVQARYIIDTIPPKIRHEFKQGKTHDTLFLRTKEKAEIRYAFDNTTPLAESYKYANSIIIPHRGKAYIKALASDQAGNRSKRFIWSHKYDNSPPIIKASHSSGTYTKIFTLSFTSSEPARILYTLDGSTPGENSTVLQQKGITISKEGVTIVRYVGIDEADNYSTENRLQFKLDISPPKVKVAIEGDIERNEFTVLLTANEPARIYYEIGKQTPSRSSPVYKQGLMMQIGQILRYFAVDNAGNKTAIMTLEDLNKPIIAPVPDGGVYKRKVHISFKKSMSTQIFWRILPDSGFHKFTEPISLIKEGSYTLEYFSELSNGIRSPFRRSQYLVDWTIPQTKIAIRKGSRDSIAIFFECSENASIYYTLDGTNPFYSATTQIVGNKFTKSKDRISVLRNREAKLAFFAQDVAGNQGIISVLDLFKPRTIPTIPSGIKRTYNRILSLELNTFDEQSQIYYEHHGKTPTVNSPVFREPITLLQSDTIKTFVIDASGYRGEIETFIYKIDLPPSPHFTFSPAQADLDQVVVFDASKTIDHESSLQQLIFLWDFDGDQTIDLKQKGKPISQYTYRQPGKYNVTLKVEDPLKRIAEISHSIFINGICPEEMVFIPRQEGKSFCIDRYEWPNIKGNTPLVNVSWVRAKMYCYDEGKRLCSAEEWQYACDGKEQGDLDGINSNKYPYGANYEVGKCPSEGEKIYKSGHFTKCEETFGTFDMIGNVWEWVSDKQNEAPMIFGGSLQFKEQAHCRFSSESSIIAENKFTGFRCCK